MTVYSQYEPTVDTISVPTPVTPTTPVTPYSNLLVGTVQAHGEDNTRFYNHGRYIQPEWYAQDSWRVSRRVTIDLGVRFQYPGTLSSPGLTLGYVQCFGLQRDPVRNALVSSGGKRAERRENLKTGAVYQLARAGFFDPSSYPASGNPYSGIVEYEGQAYNNPGLAIGPRVGFGWDVLGNGKLALRGGFGIFYDRALQTNANSANGSGVGLVTAPPGFQSPVYYNTTLTQLLAAQAFEGPATVFSGQITKIRRLTTGAWGYNGTSEKG